MKKWKASIVLILALVFAFAFTACGASAVPYADYDLAEYIKLAEYKGLEVEDVKVEVSDEDVQEEIDAELTAAATVEEKTEGKVEDGDTVNIDYVGKVDGEEFAGGSAKGYSLTIGSNAFIDGFEKGLIGKEVGGDPVVLKLQFPDPYPNNTDFSGKDVEFTVTINAKEVEVTPKLDEDFIAGTGSEAKTVDEYKAEVKEMLLEQAEDAATDEQKEYLWGEVVDNSEVLTDEDGNEKYPQEELDRVYEETISEYQDYAEQYGMEYGDFLEQMMGTSQEDFEAELKEYAKVVVKQEMVLYSIVDKEEITITDEEYDDYIAETLDGMGMSTEDFEGLYGHSFEEEYGEDLIRRYIYMDKVMDLLLENADVVDEVSE